MVPVIRSINVKLGQFDSSRIRQGNHNLMPGIIGKVVDQDTTVSIVTLIYRNRPRSGKLPEPDANPEYMIPDQQFPFSTEGICAFVPTGYTLVSDRVGIIIVSVE